MDTQELRTLKLLEEIENENAPSQRDLATRLNISLGLVNSFVKRLAKKGYFKVTHIPSNRVRYIMTPKGAAEKTRLTYEYIQYSFQYYKHSRKKLNEMFRRFQNQGFNRVAFFGVGEMAEIAYIALQETHIELVAIYDEDEKIKTFLGMTIKTPEEIPNIACDRILITTIDGRGSAMRHILDNGVPRKKIALL